MSYAEFLESKRPNAKKLGITVDNLAPHLFKYQADCVRFNLECGSGGLFLDTGLGKTACELEWAEHARNATNGRALPKVSDGDMTRTSFVTPAKCATGSTSATMTGSTRSIRRNSAPQRWTSRAF